MFSPSELWPTTGEGTFGLPPLEMERKTTKKQWRGVRFGDVSLELYYEEDGCLLNRDIAAPNLCAATGKPRCSENIIDNKNYLYVHAPVEVGWSNMNTFSSVYPTMVALALPDTYQYLERGLSNAVALDRLSYEEFHSPEVKEKSELKRTEVLTIAVSYVHKTAEPRGLLKANDFQIAQLEDILQAIRQNPPHGTKYVRLWTDQALSTSLSRTSERPRWILFGLLPYIAYTTALLFSGDETDSTSMWTSCEQSLADGGSGCLFAARKGVQLPPLCKGVYTGSGKTAEDCKAFKTFGDGLSINRNLRRLSAMIHSGALDETVTYHIADAQMLARLAYYMTKPTDDVSLNHAVSCNPCLNATCRDHFGFYWSMTTAADVVDPSDSKGFYSRINKTRLSLPYPKVRARKGYADWDGVREFLPGAGRFAKFLVPELTECFRKHQYVMKLQNEGTETESVCVVVSALPSELRTLYIALFVSGSDLYGSSPQIGYSMRLNIIDLGKLHSFIFSGTASGQVMSLFRHPDHGDALQSLQFGPIVPISEVTWGVKSRDDPARAASKSLMDRFFSSLPPLRDLLSIPSETTRESAFRDPNLRGSFNLDSLKRVLQTSKTRTSLPVYDSTFPSLKTTSTPKLKSHTIAAMRITPEQVASGMDIQGIPWESLPFSREDYRETRLRGFNHQQSPDSGHDHPPHPTKHAQFFDFSLNDRSVVPSINHFQLRNLAWATTEHDAFVVDKSSIMHWDVATREQTNVLDLTTLDLGTPTNDDIGSTLVSSMIVKDDMVIAGGFRGQLVAKNLKTDSIVYSSRITDSEDSAFVNAIDVYDKTVMTCSNDCHLRCFDLETFERISSFKFDKPLNHATRQPTGKLVIIGADENPIHIIDVNTGERVEQLLGHQDYSFATGWHPNGQIFATGSQDNTCRIWDVRNMSQSVVVLKSKGGAVYSLRFSGCGQFLVMAEKQDFVHVFDVSREDVDMCQEIDLFGEIAGVAFTPSAESLFIAVTDRTYHSLMRYQRSRPRTQAQELDALVRRLLNSHA